MARRKVVEEKNYDELITELEKEISEMSSELKVKKASLKKLQKDKIRYDEMMEKKKKEEEIQEAAQLIVESGKSLSEIRELLKK